jgi:hypothetical protein
MTPVLPNGDQQPTELERRQSELDDATQVANTLASVQQPLEDVTKLVDGLSDALGQFPTVDGIANRADADHALALTRQLYRKCQDLLGDATPQPTVVANAVRYARIDWQAALKKRDYWSWMLRITTGIDRLLDELTDAQAKLDALPPAPSKIPNPPPVLVSSDDQVYVEAARRWISGRAGAITVWVDWLTPLRDIAAGVASASKQALTDAQEMLDAISRVTDELNTPSHDPAILQARLEDVTRLRASAWPIPLDDWYYTSFGASHLDEFRDDYLRRTAELVEKTQALLEIETPVEATVPAALLPVRLETRLFPGLTKGSCEVRIRVFVDDIHIDAHDPNLTNDEVAWATYLQQQVATGDDAKASAAWAQTAARFGPHRAAYLARASQAVQDSKMRRTSVWDRPAQADALPDRWLAIAYDDNGRSLGAALGAPIRRPLPIGPDLLQQTANDGASVAGIPNWQLDFDSDPSSSAVAVGMGLRLTVDAGATWPQSSIGTVRATIARLVVIGIRSGDATETLTQLLTAHRYTDGLELLRPGTPTNNTQQAPSGHSSDDPGYAHSYELEVGNAAHGLPPTGPDAKRLASALGVDTETLRATGKPSSNALDEQAMIALTWPATWGRFLAGGGLVAANPARVEAVRSWAVAWLRPGGPLAAVRIGRQPYGVLPVLNLRRSYGIPPIVDVQVWTDPEDHAAADIHRLLTAVFPAWHDAADWQSKTDFDALVERRAVSSSAAPRFAGDITGWRKSGWGIDDILGYQLDAQIAGLHGPFGLLDALGGMLGLRTPDQHVAEFPLEPAQFALDPWDAPSPWRLGVPFVESNVTAYLKELQQTPHGATPPVLGSALDAVAAASWQATAAPGGPIPEFHPRGCLGAAEGVEPAAPDAATEFAAALAHLASRDDADFQRLLGGALDIASHRLDAWATALATRRLGQLRAKRPDGIVIGAYGWAENLTTGKPLEPAGLADEPDALHDPANRGYLTAPSVQQAVTAAVLRSGHLTHNLSSGAGSAAELAPFAIDLSSRRARAAAWLLEGLRNDQPLAALLGYRFERGLQSAGAGQLIEAARRIALADPAVDPDSPMAKPDELVRATDVADGVKLLDLFLAHDPLVSGGEWDSPAAQNAFAELVDAVDAVGDAGIAQGLHEALTSNAPGATATLAGLADGAVAVPHPTFLDTPRTGVTITHRVLVAADAATTSPADWPETPRSRAEPTLTKWAAQLLGDRPAATGGMVTLLDAAGTPVGAPAPVTIADLGLGPLDVLALAETPSEIDRLAASHVLSTGAGTNAVSARLDRSSAPALPAGAHGPSRSFADILAIAIPAGRLLSAARAADGRDFLPPGAAGGATVGVDLEELEARAQRALADLDVAIEAIAQALPGEPPPGSAPRPVKAPAAADADMLASALRGAVLLGVPLAAPAADGAPAIDVLADQARSAWAELVRRKAAIPSPSDATEAQALETHAAQIGAVFGGLRVLPVVTSVPVDALTAARDATLLPHDTEPGQLPEAWLVKVSRVQSNISALIDTLAAADALGCTRGWLSVAVAHLPDVPGEPVPPNPWLGLPFTDARPTHNAVSLAFAPADIPATSRLAALVVAEWSETIPNASETAAVTYHYDAPGAQAPQSILLAVPARHDAAKWSYDALAQTVNSARDLAHIRTIDSPPPGPTTGYYHFPSIPLVLPAIYLPNADGTDQPGAPPLPIVTPGSYLALFRDAPWITRIEPDPVYVRQMEKGSCVVEGNALAGLTSDKFSAGDGVTITIESSTVGDPATGTRDRVTLTLEVTATAEPGPRRLKVGTSESPTQAIRIWECPQVNTCVPQALSQKSVAYSTDIILSGYALTAATAVLSGSALVTSHVASTSDRHLTLSVAIAAADSHATSPGDPVNLELTVTLAGTTLKTFPITLDTLE